MEVVRFHSRGGFSVRSIFVFALTVIITAILWATFSVSTTHAQAASAAWSGTETILFDNHGYGANTELKDTTGTIPSGSIVYTAPVQGVGTTSQKLLVLFFAPGVDPPTATNVKFVEFAYNGSTISSPTTPRDVALTAQGKADSVSSSCSVSGIGWIICPVSIWLAEGMDWLFGMLSDLIKVQPLNLASTNNSAYQAWSIMRTISNIAFVIVFLIIIYAQLTNVGISNYGLKKLIPRLIIAAVLVNVSYFITALAIDISNILGYSVQDIFNGLREQLFHVTNDNVGGINTIVPQGGWAALTAIVLAGGGYFGASYLITGGATVLLVPILLGLGLTLLFVFLILAARQAIIIILVIIAPLAFVAYLLPNTEKWFEKWKDIFMTMLIFFPAFSLVFGGSQLAGQIIIQNAGDNIVMLILGMAVQVAPLVITPLILKFSGGLLGKIAQIANNPRKGILDRNKNWAQEKADLRRQKTLGKPPITGKFKRTRTALAPGAGVRLIDGNRRARKTALETAQKNADSRWEETNRAKKLSEYTAKADDNKARVHSDHERHINELRSGTGHRYAKKIDLHTIAIEAEDAKTGAEMAEAQFSAITSEYRSGKYNTRGNKELADLQKSMAKRVMETTAFKRAAEGASVLQQYEYAQEINTLTPRTFTGGKTLQEIAAGIDPNGAQRAQASAVAVIQEIRTKTISNMEKIIAEQNPTPPQLLELLRGNSTIPGVKASQDAVAAAANMILGGPDTGAIVEALQTVDLSFNSYPGFSPDERKELQVLAGKALESNGSKPPFASAGVIGKLKQGQAFNGAQFTGAYGASGVNNWIIDIINAKKIDSGKLQSAGNDYAKVILDAVSSAAPGAITNEAKAKLLQHLNITLDPNREAFEKLGDSQETLDALRKLL